MFTDGRSTFPIGMNGHRPDPSKPRGREFADGLQKVSGDAGRGC
jgi:hypothetical protein